MLAIRPLSATESAMNEVVLQSVLVCSVCGFAKQERMPTDACQFFYECSNCKTLLRPKPGDCCVSCFLRLGEMSADAGKWGLLRC